jgi:hypothetical protein
MTTPAKTSAPSPRRHATTDRLGRSSLATETSTDESWARTVQDNSDWLARTSASAHDAIERHYTDGVRWLNGHVREWSPDAERGENWFGSERR